MIGVQLESIGMDARGSEPMIGDESEGPMTQISWEVKSVFDSNTEECVPSVAGSIHPSSDGTTCSELKSGAAAGVISWSPSDGRSKSCSSRL